VAFYPGLSFRCIKVAPSVRLYDSVWRSLIVWPRLEENIFLESSHSDYDFLAVLFFVFFPLCFQAVSLEAFRGIDVNTFFPFRLSMTSQ